MIRSANESESALYVVGGGTGLAQGATPTEDGDALEVGGWNKIVDYPARDMTITVQAGVTMREIAEGPGHQGLSATVQVFARRPL